MTNLLQRGTTWLGQQLKQALSVSITYTRRGVSASLLATVRLDEYEIIDEDDITTIAQSRDYVLHAADLTAGGIELPPRPGDRIGEVVGGVAMVFEVLPAGDRNEYEAIDTDYVLYRVRTKQVAA